MTAGNPWDKVVEEDTVFKTAVLSGHDKREWPRRIDYVAKRVAEGDFTVGSLDNPTLLSDATDVERKARKFYLQGIAELTGDRHSETALSDDFDLGSLLVEFQGLRDGLADVEKEDIPPGEVLSRLVTRTVQRQSRGQESSLASQLRPDAETPRELVAELTTAPELADVVAAALPDAEDPATLTAQLASLDLSTELWTHQLESLALWLYHGASGYVDMATATGKTVLGLAAVAHIVEAGSLHPADQQRLEDIFDGNVPEPDHRRPDDVLIVTTDDLLGIQWARLFQEHCHTPEEFTRITDEGITLPEMSIEIRSAGSLDDIDPADYGLAIFDEVHNYSSRSGWGDNLVAFVESSCPVLALTGSVTDDFRATVRRADAEFPVVYRYTHQQALSDGVIPDFEWTLRFTDVSESDALDRLHGTAERFRELITYDDGRLHVEASALESVAPDLDDTAQKSIVGSYTSGTALANHLREAGDGETAPTEWLESLAKGLSDRTLDRLNLTADRSAVADEAERALADGRPTLVLTRTYKEAKALWQQLYDGSDDRVVKRLEAGASAEDHAATIQAFDEASTEEKVLIGPGNRIGQGNDIHSVEVGINIARPGSGVTASLVQRLGRLLRDADSKESVQFHHIMGVQPGESAVEPDGESFVGTVSEFFGQVLEPDTDGILKVPTVGVDETVADDIATLEQLGVGSIDVADGATVIESAYAAAIAETPPTDPAVSTEWFSAAYGVTADTQAMVAASDREQTQDEAGTEGGSGAEDSDTEHPPRSPLAEHYDAFRSLGIIHRGLSNSGLDALEASDPFRRWVALVSAIVDEEGFGEQPTGYGTQLADSNVVDVDELRETYGDGKRITDFESVAITDPPAVVLALIGERFADLASWHVPVTPETETQLPVLVESEAELQRARELLEEFPPTPPELSEVASDPAEADPKAAGEAQSTSANTEEAATDGDEDTPTPGDQAVSATPVADIRSVSAPAAEALSAAGFETLGDLRAASDPDLEAVEGISKQRIALIRASVGSE